MKKLVTLIVALTLVLVLAGCNSEPETIEVEVPVPYEVEVIKEVEVEKVVYVDRYVPTYSENPVILKSNGDSSFELKFMEAQTIRIVLAGNQWNMGFIFDGVEYFVDGARTFEFEVEEGTYEIEVFSTHDTQEIRFELWFWTLNE